VNDTARSVIDNYIEAWNSHDIDAILGFFDEDCQYEDEALRKVMVGHDQLRQFFETMYRGFPNCGFEVVSVFQAIDCIAWEWIMAGNYSGVGNSGLAPTGRAMRVRGASITEFKNDRIIRNTDYWNMARMMRQLDGSESI
jgi:steroid delta-isomerase-like uncharacterized protein